MSPSRPVFHTPDPEGRKLTWGYSGAGARSGVKNLSGRWRAGRAGVLAAWCALLTAVVLWPFVEGLVAGFRGQALVLRDMVVPPTMALNDLARGADGPARAVPQDAVLALLSPVIPPPVVVSALMLAAGFAGALGAAALAGRHGARLPGRFLAATVVLWNPYVAERLLQGHWSVVAAGMLLPLVAWLVTRLADGTGTRDSDRGRPRQRGRCTAALILVLAVCALTPTGLVLGVVTACTAAGWRRRALVPLGAGVLLALPWLLPSLLSATDTLADSRGAELFAARAEPFVGTPGALAGLGGIWNAQAVPASRASGPAALAGVVLALVAVAVVVVLVRRRMLPGPLRRLMVLAAVAVVVPALAATGPGLALLGGLLETVPGAGLLRDTQKFVVLALPALAVLLSLLPGLLPSLVRGRAGAAAVVAASCLLVWLQVPALPRDLADLRPVTLDARYAQVADGVSGGRTLLWPPGNYRVIAGRPALDPLLKMLPGSPVDPGYLVVDGQVVDGDPETVALLAGLADGTVTVRDLTDHGIDRVVVTGDGADPLALPDALADLTPTWSDGDWRLVDLR